MKTPYYSVRTSARRPATAGPAGTLLRPYVDLAGAGGPIHARILATLAGAAAAGTVVGLTYQGNTPAVFRGLLLRETGLLRYSARRPDDLPPELRTPQWQAVCGRAGAWDDLPGDHRVELAALLNRLGLFDATLALVRPVGEEAVASDPVAAALAVKRANAVFKTTGGQDVATVTATLAAVALHGADERVRLSAAANLVVHHAKISRDVAEIARWGAVADEHAGVLRPDDDAADRVARSAYLRATSFVPFFHRDMERVRRMLDECEDLARSVPATSPEVALLAEENLYAVLETRTKEASAVGDRDGAAERLVELCEHDPLDPKARRSLGDHLLAGGDVAGALRWYRDAALLGPPYSALAWFRVGECHRLLGDPELACLAYLRSLRADPLAVSALAALRGAARRCGNVPLVAWSDERLAGITAGRNGDRRGPDGDVLGRAAHGAVVA